MEKRKNHAKKGPTKKTLDVVYIHSENKQRLERLHDESLLTSPAVKFHPFAEGIVVDFLDSKESQRKFIHPIEFKAIVDQHIVLMDNMTGKPALVAMTDAKKSLHCDTCDSGDCHHVGFAYGNHNACNILVKKGFFQPR
ncbi:MAG: hypothetical protein ACREAX_03800 [Candidatus Nitrosotenuis sp.]